MLELNAINDQAIYVDEDLVYLDNLMIRLDCAADIYNRLGKNIECSEEDFKQFTRNAVQWVKTTIDKIIAALKYIVELLKKGIPRALSKLSEITKNYKSTETATELKAKATVMCMWSDKLNGFQRDRNNKLSGREFQNNDELEKITNTYTSMWGKWKSVTPKIMPKAENNFRSSIVYLENLIANTANIKSHIEQYISKHNARFDESILADKRHNEFVILLSLYGFNNASDTKIVFSDATVRGLLNNVLKDIHKKQHAYAIWFKYARETLSLEQSIATGKKSKGFLYFYDIPQAVRSYLANYYKEFYDTKGHAILKTNRICVYSDTQHAAQGAVSSRGLAHGLAINLNSLLRHGFKMAALTVLHELSHSSQDIHRKQVGTTGHHYQRSVPYEWDKPHDERTGEILADKAAAYFIMRVDKGKIPEDNPFYAWLHKVISAIKQQMKTIHYTLPNTSSIKREDLPVKINLTNRMSRFQNDDV